MGFKMNKVAAAVTATLGVTVVGIGAAQADEILFPYIVTSATVTTLVSTMNSAGPFSGQAAPTELHYRYWYKNGDSAENNSAPCVEVNRPFPSSANDIVTFDVGGTLQKDNLGILFEDVKVSTLPDGNNRGYGNSSFSLLGRITQPVRAFLVVDNNDFTTTDAAAEAFFRTSPSLAGEVIVLEFVNGAAWGYGAYNPAGRYTPPPNNARINLYDFSDYVETAGEVIASENASENESDSVPVAIAPRSTTANADDIITKFFVTPIAPTRFSPLDQRWVEPGGLYRWNSASPSDPPAIHAITLPNQLRGDLNAVVALGAFDTNLGAVVMYDRDEGPVSGQVPQSVTCVGAVDVKSMLTEGAQNQIPKGGWSNLIVATVAKDPVSRLPTTSIVDTDEAVVIKLEYNTLTSPSLDTAGIVNNAIWLRRGIKESIPTPTNGTARLELRTVGFDINVVQSSAD